MSCVACQSSNCLFDQFLRPVDPDPTQEMIASKTSQRQACIFEAQFSGANTLQPLCRISVGFATFVIASDRATLTVPSLHFQHYCGHVDVPAVSGAYIVCTYHELRRWFTVSGTVIALRIPAIMGSSSGQGTQPRGFSQHPELVRTSSHHHRNSPSTSSEPRHKGLMTSTKRTQSRYDHRRPQLVETAGDIKLATQHGVPASAFRITDLI